MVLATLVLAETLGSAGCKIRTWVWMSNHSHLLIETLEPNWVRGMTWFPATYFSLLAKWINLTPLPLWERFVFTKSAGIRTAERFSNRCWPRSIVWATAMRWEELMHFMMRGLEIGPYAKPP